MYQLRVTPENARANLNFLNRAQLGDLLVGAGFSYQAAGRLAAFVEARVRKKPLARWDEVLALPGVTPDVVRQLQRHFTLFTQTPRLHLGYTDA